MEFEIILFVLFIGKTSGHSLQNDEAFYIPFFKASDGFDKDCVTKEYFIKTMMDLVGNITTALSQRENLKEIVDNMIENITTILSEHDHDSQHKKKARDCEDIKYEGHKKSGVYTIYPDPGNEGISVRCDMDTTTGGWTVIQRRVSDTDFYKNWTMYEHGFGDLNNNFWLGNRYIHMISSQDAYQLRIDLTSSDDETAYAQYNSFVVGDAESRYKLSLSGYSGTAGDSLLHNLHAANGMKFTTYDNDNDVGSSNCAISYHGAWWYANCHASNLNGDYGNTKYATGPVWSDWKGHHNPMKTTEMKIKKM